MIPNGVAWHGIFRCRIFYCTYNGAFWGVNHRTAFLVYQGHGYRMGKEGKGKGKAI
jgi:hypothetical protein